MNIKRINYKMDRNDDWKVGYIIGNYDGDNRTLLDSKFEYVPKLKENGKEYVCYDLKDNVNKVLNLTID